MTTSQYTVCGGVIFIEGRTPMTIERASLIKTIHESNAVRWLMRDDLSDAARNGMAKIEIDLAKEMEAAIRQATNSKLEQAA